MNGYVINNLRFADDVAATTENQQELQLIMDNIVTESARMGMKVNIKKTEVQHVGLVEKEVIILIENQKLKQVKDFVYLGGNMSNDASTEQDVKEGLGVLVE